MNAHSNTRIDLLLILPRQDLEPDLASETAETGWWQQVGHGVLATEALSHGLSVKVVDASTYDSQNDFLDDLRHSFRATVAGLTPSITTPANTLATLKVLRQVAELTVLGGHMVSQFRTLHNLSRDYHSLVDAICVGDGRGLFSAELGVVVDRIRNGFRNLFATRRLLSNPLEQSDWSSALQQSFSTPVGSGHPVPYAQVFELHRYWRKYALNYLRAECSDNRYRKPVAIQTMQGCPFRVARPCVFCNRMERNVRSLRADVVLSEVDAIASAGGDSIIVVEDSGILASPALARDLAERWPRNVGIVFSYAHVKSISEESAKLLTRLNCERVFIGVESGDDECLATLGKNFSASEVYSACKVLQENGIRVSPSFIIGAPPEGCFRGESVETSANTRRLAERLLALGNIDLGFANVLIPYDGSTAFEMLVSRLPDRERTRVETTVFMRPEDLQRLWCEHVLTIDYDEACRLRDALLSMFPRPVQEYRTS